MGYDHLHCKNIKANRMDICLTNKKANTCLLIDVGTPHVAMSDPGGSVGLGRFGRSAHRHCCMETGHYSRSPQPAALTENSACFWDLLGSSTKSPLRVFKAMTCSHAVPQRQGLLRVLVIDIVNQTGLQQKLIIIIFLITPQPFWRFSVFLFRLLKTLL